MILGLQSLQESPEGCILGWFSSGASPHYPRLSVASWLVLTVSLAVFGWAVGSAIPIFGTFSEQEQVVPSPQLIIAFPLLFGIVVGAFFGSVQALELRRAALRSYWWIIVNTTAGPLHYQ